MSNLQKGNQIKELSSIFLIPLVAAVVFVPLIVRIRYYDTKLGDCVWFYSDPNKLDVFHYWKMVWLILIATCMLVVMAGMFLYAGSLAWHKIFIPLGIYALFCILSTFFSVSQYHSIHGFYDMFESVFTLLAYCIICYYAFAFISTEKRLRTAAIWVLVGAALLGIIGTSQYLCHDLVMSTVGKNLILPSSYGEKYSIYPSTLTLQFGEGRVYETLYNPNYAGVYTGMIMPLLIVMTVTVDKLKKLAVYIPLIILTLLSLVGSSSRAGMIAILGSIVLLVVMFHTVIIKYWKQAAVIALIFIVGVVGFDFAKNHVISQRFMTIFDDSGEEETTPLLSSIQLNDENYTVVYNDQELIFENYQWDESNISPAVTDSEGNEIEVLVETSEDGTDSYYVLDGEKYQGLVIRPVYTGDDAGTLGIQICADGYQYVIYYSEADATYYYINNQGKSCKMMDSETADWGIFNLFGGFGGRRYIWSKSVPLLKKYLFIGSGPDTFSFVFPMTDYIDANNNGYGSQIITKPHSMYLQTAIQTGMISLIAWLVFYFWYFVSSFRLYFRREYKTFAEKFGVAVMIATASYMISGIANDSNPSVAPIYWGLLGIGIAANVIVKRTRKEEAEKQIRREQAIAQAKAKRENK